MHPRQALPAAVERLAIHQASAITSEQVEAAGVSRAVVDRLLREGRWQRLGQRVYAMTPSPSWETLAWAGCLCAGEQARLGARASGFVTGLVTDAPERPDVLVPWSSRVRTRGPWEFVRERPGVRDSRTWGSPPRIGAVDTVLDLCAGGSESEVVTWVTRAVQRRLVRPEAILVGLDRRRRHPRRALLTGMLADVAAGAESQLEIRYLRDVERAHGLPPGKRQRSRLGLPYVTDVCYDVCRLIVELGGRLGHEGEGRFRDMWRDNAHLVEGHPTMRYGWYHVTECPCEAAWQVAEVLVRLGWTGLPERCRRCLRVM